MPEQAQQAQATQNQIPLPLTLDDEFFLKRVLDWKEERRKAEEELNKLPKEVRDWLVENGFDDPIFILEPSEALAKLAYALAYSEDYYDYSVHVVKTEHGDAIVIDIWIPTLGYDTIVIVLPDGEVIAFQYG